MKKTDAAIKMIVGDIENKDVLEVACGAADFSISATVYARKVHCIDVVDFRLKDRSLQGAQFHIMDATNMSFSDNTFDTVVLYNAFFHVREQWNEIESECKRVLKENGSMIVLSTWSLEHEMLAEVFGDKVHQDGEFLIVRIRK